jgi:predicted phage terminase large subunit-like protein
MTRQETNKVFGAALKEAEKTSNDVLRDTFRFLSLSSLFFFLVHVLRRPDADRDFVYDRCNEVQANPDGYLDLWAREFYKSSVITFALNIQDVLKNPEETTGIFSHTRPIAKAFLRQIKNEFEQNLNLYWIFPDIVIPDPQKNAPKWSEDEGIIPVRRSGNPNEASFEAWGLVDGQPTSKHYSKMVYDDIVTIESVSTPEQIKKTTDAWRMSRNLGKEGGRTRHIGTRFHFNDTYSELIKAGVAIPRIYTATDNGKPDGKPILYSPEYIEKKKKEMGSYIFNCQMLMNPAQESAQIVQRGWWKWYREMPKSCIRDWHVWDTAFKDKQQNDPTGMWGILETQTGYYVYDRLNEKMIYPVMKRTMEQKYVEHAPDIILVEDKASGQSVIQDIRFNSTLPIVPFKTEKDKRARLNVASAHVEAGNFYLPEDKPWAQEIVDNVANFGVIEHDEDVDILSSFIIYKTQAPKDIFQSIGQARRTY